MKIKTFKATIDILCVDKTAPASITLHIGPVPADADLGDLPMMVASATERHIRTLTDRHELAAELEKVRGELAAERAAAKAASELDKPAAPSLVQRLAPGKGKAKSKR